MLCGNGWLREASLLHHGVRGSRKPACSPQGSTFIQDRQMPGVCAGSAAAL